MPEELKTPQTSEAAKTSEPAAPVVGPQLKARRQALRMSLAQVEIATKIRGKYLTALEAGDYAKLPNDIYSRGFVQHYANHLGLDGPALAAAYVAERGGLKRGATRRPQLERPRRLVFTGQIVGLGVVLLAVAGVLAYLLWQFSALAGSPRLSVTSPDGDRSLTGSVIDVTGSTTPGSDVKVDDSPVLTDTDGNFSEKVALHDGVNVIHITSMSKLGKTTTVTRNILATLPKVEATQVTVPPAVFDGVAVAVSVSETTSMVVNVDGKEAWRGTVVAGRSMVFTGKDDINLTTGNAGVTSVVVTNRVVAAKKIDSLGRPGEIRRGQDFAKDTVIP
ncbi:MAG TPA: RodZ domain-containing protein [Candidatus Saccharimonadia bacterium]